MKVVRSKNQLTLVGKAWEIKYKLKELAKANITVKEYLKLFSTL